MNDLPSHSGLIKVKRIPDISVQSWTNISGIDTYQTKMADFIYTEFA